eukprot:3968136-Pleurochrysis_carterae.AAC.1
MAVRAPKGTRGVKCRCGHRFCFSCAQEDHTPCSCEELQQWIAKCKDDSETFNWLVSNTKVAQPRALAPSPGFALPFSVLLLIDASLRRP